MFFKFNGLKKKILAALLVGGLTLGVPQAEAGWGEAILNAGAAAIQMESLRSQMKKQLTYYNETEEGRQELFAQYKEKYGVNDDGELNYRVNALMNALTKAVGSVDSTIYNKPYIYFVNNQETINAFCAPGRIVSINTGLLKLFPNDDEVAVVVGHEMGHGQKDHPVSGTLKQINKAKLAVIGAAAASGTVGGNILGNILVNQTMAHSTKAQEKEADDLAFLYLTNSNFNPGACAAVWQRFLDKEGDNAQNAVGSIFAPSDHPNNAARRDTYVKKLEEYSGNNVSAKDGTVTVHGKFFTAPAATDNMSQAERSYFILGNLAAAFHNRENINKATVKNGVVMLGKQPIIQILSGDEDAKLLANRLNEIK